MSQAIADYAFRHWKRHGLTEWPTVRQTAKALRIRQSAIIDYEGVDYELTAPYSYDVGPAGDWYVEAETDEVEQELCAYWLPFSRSCTCGKHR